MNEIANELLQFIREASNSSQLTEMLKGKTLIVRESCCELDRTLELQVLDTQDDVIEVSVFSDGPLGTIGASAIYDANGMLLTSAPKVFINGVPCIDIPTMKGDRRK